MSSTASDVGSKIEKWWRTKILGKKDDDSSSTASVVSSPSYRNQNNRYNPYVQPIKHQGQKTRPVPPNNNQFQPGCVYNQPGLERVQPQSPSPSPSRSQRQQNKPLLNYQQNPYDKPYHEVIRNALEASKKSYEQEQRRKRIYNSSSSDNRSDRSVNVRQIDRWYDNISDGSSRVSNNSDISDNNSVGRNSSIGNSSIGRDSSISNSRNSINSSYSSDSGSRSFFVDNSGNISSVNNKSKIDQRQLEIEAIQKFNEHSDEIDRQYENNSKISDMSQRNRKNWFKLYQHKTNTKTHIVHGVRIRFDNNGTDPDYIMWKIFNYIIHYLKFDVKKIESYASKPKSKQYDDCIEFYFYESRDQKSFISAFNRKTVHICGKSVKAEACPLWRKRLDDDLMSFIANHPDRDVEHGWFC